MTAVFLCAFIQILYDYQKKIQIFAYKFLPPPVKILTKSDERIIIILCHVKLSEREVLLKKGESMKKISKIAIVIMMFVAALFAITACGDKVDSITIESSNMPQLVFVAGQDLDLSAGKLTATKNEETEEIALDSADVSVTGYDKNTLGEQELTIEYKGQTTTLTVTVVSRMVVSGYTVNYFVGESFDKTKGTATITRDDGTTFTAALSDDKITIENFDNSVAASPLTVTARYQSGSENYTGTFTVNVYAPTEVSMKTPSKVTYKSHEEGIDLSGGYITLKSAAYTKYIELTEDMISGFDLSAATMNNRTDALEQTIFVKYEDVTTQSYTIRILYSEVSLIKQRASELASLDFESEIPSISKTQGENAIEALNAYYNIEDESIDLISEEEILLIARVAAVYAHELWLADSENYGDVLLFEDDGISLVCETYEQTKAGLALLNDEAVIVSMGNLLTALANEFGDDTLYGEVLISDYLSDIPSSDDLASSIKMLEFIVSIYELLAPVPANWKAGEIPTEEEVAALDDYSTQMSYVIGLISSYGYTTDVDTSYRTLYSYVASWREDYFDILYWYFYSQQNTTALSLLWKVYLPGELEELYEMINYAYYLTIFNVYGYTTETLKFMYYYEEIEKLSNQIISGDNLLYRILYNYYNFATLRRLNLTSSDYGYYYLMGAALGDEALADIWEQYIAIYYNCLTDEDYLGGNDFGAAVAVMFHDFAALSPAKQYAFFLSLHALYGNNPPYATYYQEGCYSNFVYFLVNYYGEELPSEAESLFQYLLLAMESYSRHSAYTAQLDSFLKYMENAQKIYDGLSAAIQSSVDDVIGEVYEKYVAIYNRYQTSDGETGGETDEDTDTETQIDYTQFGDMAGSFERLNDLVGQIITMYPYYKYFANGYFPYSWVISAYAEAESLAKLIVASEYADAFYYDDLVVLYSSDSDGNTTARYWTFDYAMYYVRNVYIYFMTGVSNSYGYTLYDFYSVANEDGKFSAFMAEYASSLAFADLDELDEETATGIIKLMAKFRELDGYAQMLFIKQFDVYKASYSFYYLALNSYLSNVLNENAYTVASNLLTAETYYTSYKYYSSLNGYEEEAEKYLGYFERQMVSIIAAYNSLSNEVVEETDDSVDGETETESVSDKQSFDTYMSDAYNYYLSVYEELTAEEDEEDAA